MTAAQHRLFPTISRHYWHSHLLRHRQSGVSVAQYCRRMALPASQFYYQRSKRRREFAQNWVLLTRRIDGS